MIIYFDNNATTRTLPEVLAEMAPYFTEHFANLSSPIASVTGVCRKVEECFKSIATNLGAIGGEQFILTSGATESNNLALLGAYAANPKRNHLVLSPVEHPSVIETADALKKCGCRISTVSLTSDGAVDIDSLINLLDRDTLLVSIMFANNETGIIQPIKEIAEVVKNFDSAILFHTDATQAIGKLSIELFEELDDIDLLSLSAHKFHGPKGVGALYLRDTDLIAPILHGGKQQQGMRAGTENVAGLVGMATALSFITSLESAWEPIRFLRDELEAGVCEMWPGSFVIGKSLARLANTSYICIPGIDAESLVDRMAMKGVAIATGSACAYGAKMPSYVALAHGLNYELARCCVRFSLSIETSAVEVKYALEALENEISEVWQSPSIKTL